MQLPNKTQKDEESRRNFQAVENAVKESDAAFAAHAADTANPHSVTAAQAGAVKLVKSEYNELGTNSSTTTGWWTSAFYTDVVCEQGDTVLVNGVARASTNDNSTAVVVTYGAIGGTAPPFTNQVKCIEAVGGRSVGAVFVAPNALTYRIYLAAYRPSSSYIHAGSADSRFTALSVVQMRG